CQDCMGRAIVCKSCCSTMHANQPFHQIKCWNGRFFESISLKDIGLVVQLSHQPGEHCSAPSTAPRSFVVLHTNGFHPVNLQFCQLQQLLRYELYPATLDDPTTCCTFRTLETFHLLTLQSKLMAYDYYITLTKLTDCVSIGQRYVNLSLLKRAGRGYDSKGVNATRPGELCTRCPACPQPGVNLPEN
ncbi:uncharacterized protein PHACADRAFT_106782, partial [Phanerochaete carnosa HHB-10118-sp]